MAYGTTLSQLRDQLRAEIGASQNVGQNVSAIPMYDHLIRRTQARLWQETDWAHLIVERDETLLAGQTNYTFHPDIDFDRIRGAWVKWSTAWEPLEYGIEPVIYNGSDPDDDDRSDPVCRWQKREGNTFEVWPKPASNLQQIVRFRAIKKLGPLVANSDVADLDDTLIVLFAAAELLMKEKSPSAQMKADLAASHYRALRANQSKRSMFIKGGGFSDGGKDYELKATYLPGTVL